MIASNYSKAVNLLMHLSAVAARALGDGADIEIVERHHHFKKDAPSGTALRLAEVVGEAIGTGPDRYAHGREGLVGERPGARSACTPCVPATTRASTPSSSACWENAWNSPTVP